MTTETVTPFKRPTLTLKRPAAAAAKTVAAAPDPTPAAQPAPAAALDATPKKRKKKHKTLRRPESLPAQSTWLPDLQAAPAGQFVVSGQTPGGILCHGTVVHATRERANEEAARLASVRPGCYVILQVLETVGERS